MPVRIRRKMPMAKILAQYLSSQTSPSNTSQQTDWVTSIVKPLPP
jgi:hypothetical protein